jgi:hypothetical protein
MPAESSPSLQHITDIFNSTKTINNSKLVYLSALNKDELELFSEIWTNAALKRRQDIMSKLVHLSEVDFSLDFSSVFVSALSDSDETI